MLSSVRTTQMRQNCGMKKLEFEHWHITFTSTELRRRQFCLVVTPANAARVVVVVKSCVGR